MVRAWGMRATVFHLHRSGHVDVYLHRGDRGRCIAIVQWHGVPMCYRVEPTDHARDSAGQRINSGTWAPDLAEAVKIARTWE